MTSVHYSSRELADGAPTASQDDATTVAMVKARCLLEPVLRMPLEPPPEPPPKPPPELSPCPKRGRVPASSMLLAYMGWRTTED